MGTTANKNRFENAVWVEVFNANGRKPKPWERRWLMLQCGRVYVPLPSNAGSEGLRAIRDGAPYEILHGRLYVEADWLARNRKGPAANVVAIAVRKIRAAAGCS